MTKSKKEAPAVRDPAKFRERIYAKLTAEESRAVIKEFMRIQDELWERVREKESSWPVKEMLTKMIQ